MSPGHGYLYAGSTVNANDGLARERRMLVELLLGMLLFFWFAVYFRYLYDHEDPAHGRLLSARGTSWRTGEINCRAVMLSLPSSKPAHGSERTVTARRYSDRHYLRVQCAHPWFYELYRKALTLLWETVPLLTNSSASLSARGCGKRQCK